MTPTNLRMCRFYLNGEPELGEYIQMDDGTGLCHISGLNDEGRTIVVSYPDGTMPDDINDLKLINVPFSVDYDLNTSIENILSPEVRERMSKT